MEGNVIISVRRKAPAGAQGPCAAWSRRRFVGQGILTIAAAAPVLARAAAGLIPESPPGLSALEGTADVTGKGGTTGTGTTGTGVPGASTNTGSGAVRSATEGENRLTTVVYINGRGPFRFLIDTGAERTLIAEEIAMQLALPRGRRVMVEGITSGRPAALAEVASLRMGTLVCAGLEVPVLPRAMLKVDGYLGLDVLDRHRVILDFRGRTLTVEQQQGFFAALWERADEAIVHTLGSSGRLRATNCLVNGIRAAAFIDTGAEVSVANPALYAQLLRHAPHRQVVRGPVGLYGVTGGTIIGLGTDIDEIVLGALHLTYTPLVIAPLEVFHMWGLAHQPALLFGMDCLRRFARVSIDYGRKELRFEVAESQIAQPLEAGLSPPLMG
jgi:predicted aspartyl protease